MIATDHGSIDGTTEILEGYASQGHLRRIAVTGEMQDGGWRTQHGTDRGNRATTLIGSSTQMQTSSGCRMDGSLKETFAGIPAEYSVVFALSRHFVPRPEDDAFFAERMIVRASPAVALNDPTSPYRPHLKVAHRGDPDITISHGSHSASSTRWKRSIIGTRSKSSPFPVSVVCTVGAQGRPPSPRRQPGWPYSPRFSQAKPGVRTNATRASPLTTRKLSVGSEEESLVVDRPSSGEPRLGLRANRCPVGDARSGCDLRERRRARCGCGSTPSACRRTRGSGGSVEGASRSSLPSRTGTFAAAVLVVVVLVAVALPEASAIDRTTRSRRGVLPHEFH